MKTFSADIVETYNWLRHKGVMESDVPKILGGKRQYFHTLRKQNGSSEYELATHADTHSFFKGF